MVWLFWEERDSVSGSLYVCVCVCAVNMWVCVKMEWVWKYQNDCWCQHFSSIFKGTLHTHTHTHTGRYPTGSRSLFHGFLISFSCSFSKESPSQRRLFDLPAVTSRQWTDQISSCWANLQGWTCQSYICLFIYSFCNCCLIFFFFFFSILSTDTLWCNFLYVFLMRGIWVCSAVIWIKSWQSTFLQTTGKLSFVHISCNILTFLKYASFHMLIKCLWPLTSGGGGVIWAGQSAQSSPPRDLSTSCAETTCAAPGRLRLPTSQPASRARPLFTLP